MAQQPSIVPVPGITKLHRLEENIGAADVVLTPGNLGAIAALATVTVHGDRSQVHLQASGPLNR